MAPGAREYTHDTKGCRNLEVNGPSCPDKLCPTASPAMAGGILEAGPILRGDRVHLLDLEPL